MQQAATDWWVEITTLSPRCVYYFGSFPTNDEAKAAYDGYVQDLDSEGARGIIVVIQRCQPQELTVCEDEDTEVI